MRECGFRRTGSNAQAPHSAAVTIAGQIPSVNRAKPAAVVAVNNRQASAASAARAATVKSGDNFSGMAMPINPASASSAVQIASAVIAHCA